MKFIRKEVQERTTFRITPHGTLENKSLRKLMVQLHELFLIKRSRVRFEFKGGFCIAIRPSPDIWFVVKMGADDDGRRIEFYISVPSNYSEAFKTKFRNHEQWRRSTIEEVDDFVFPEEDHTDLYKLQYKRHDIFSLRVDHAEQTTPIRDFLTVSDELKPGESIDLFIRSESMERKKWKRIADYAWTTWEKERVPARPGVDPVRFARNLFSVVAYLAVEVVSILRDAFQALQNQFLKKEEAKDKGPVFKITDPERAEILIDGKLSTRTNEKRVRPTFKTSIRVAVHSEDDIRRDMLARSVGAVYDNLSENNSLQVVRVKIKPKKALDDLRQWRVFDPMSQIMSVDETAKMWQLPTADVQKEFSDAIVSNQRVETEIDARFLDDSGILVGTATDRGVTNNIHIPSVDKDMLFTPRGFIGSPRMGKDQAVINLIVEAKRKHGIGAIVPDVIDERNGHRGMGDALRDHLPPEDVIDIDLGDTKNPVYFGLESIVKNVTDIRMQADRIAEEITAFLLDGEEDDKIQTADYTRECAKSTLGDVLGMKLMFMSKRYRKEKIEANEDVFDMDIWKDFDKMSDGKQGQIYAPVMRRIGQIMGSEFLKPMFCQLPSRNTLDLYQAIKEGKVVIFRIRIPGSTLSERVKQILVYWIVMNVFLICASMDGDSPGTMLVLNEPHQFLSNGLVKFMSRMLREGPKYKLIPIPIFHDFSAFREYPGFTDVLLSSSINWHIFKNSNLDVYKKLFPYISGTFQSPEQAFEATKRFQYIASFLKEGEHSPAFVVDALPMVGDRYETMNNSYLTLRHSKQYGRPIEHVMSEIKGRNKLTFQTDTA